MPATIKAQRLSRQDPYEQVQCNRVSIQRKDVLLTDMGPQVRSSLEQPKKYPGRHKKRPSSKPATTVHSQATVLASFSTSAWSRRSCPKPLQGWTSVISACTQPAATLPFNDCAAQRITLSSAPWLSHLSQARELGKTGRGPPPLRASSQ